MATLTWRDVAAPDASASLYGLTQAGQNIQNAANTGIQALQSFQKTNEDAANAAVLAKAMQYQNPDDLRAAIASGALPTQGMSAAGVQALNNQIGSQIEQRLNQTKATAAQHDLSTTLANEDFQKAHGDLLSNYQTAIASGNPTSVANATSALQAAGANWNMLQDLGKAAGTMGQQAAAIRASNANVALDSAHMGLIGAQTREINDNIGLKRSSALLGSQLAQAEAIDPSSGPAVVQDFIKNGGDPRAASPFLSQLAATAARTAGTPSGGVVSGGKGSPAIASTGDMAVDAKLADALRMIRGNNPDADKVSLQAAVNSTDNASDFLPQYAKNMGVKLTELNPVINRIKSFVKDKQGVTINDKTAAELAMRNFRDPSLTHPSELFDAFNDFPSEQGKMIDRDGVLKDAASLVPDASGVSPAQRAFSLDQKNASTAVDLSDYAQKAVGARNELLRLYRLKEAGASSPQLDAAIDKNTKLRDAYINRLDQFGKSN